MALLKRRNTPVPEQAPPATEPATAEQAQQPAVVPATSTPKERAAKYTAQLNDARALREQMLRELSQGADKEEQLRTLDSEIADLEKRLAWIKEANALEAKRNSKDARNARLARTKVDLQGALDDARALGKDAEALLAVIADIGTKLRAMAETRDAISYRYSDAIAAAIEAKPTARAQRDLEERHSRLGDLLDAIVLPGHMHRALWDAGLGRIGVHLPQHSLTIRPLNGIQSEDGTAPTAEVVAKVADQLKALANKQLITLLEAKEAA